MDKNKKSENQKNEQNGNEIIQNQENIICSPEFPDGCMDVETGETEE